MDGHMSCARSVAHADLWSRTLHIIDYKENYNPGIFKVVINFI